MNEESKTKQRIKEKSKNQRHIKESNIMKDESLLSTTVKKIRIIQIETLCKNDAVRHVKIRSCIFKYKARERDE